MSCRILVFFLFCFYFFFVFVVFPPFRIFCIYSPGTSWYGSHKSAFHVTFSAIEMLMFLCAFLSFSIAGAGIVVGHSIAMHLAIKGGGQVIGNLPSFSFLFFKSHCLYVPRSVVFRYGWGYSLKASLTAGPILVCPGLEFSGIPSILRSTPLFMSSLSSSSQQ